VPSQTVATSDVSLRADLYSAILKLLQFLKRPRPGAVEAGGQRTGGVGATPPDVEEVLSQVSPHPLHPRAHTYTHTQSMYVCMYPAHQKKPVVACSKTPSIPILALSYVFVHTRDL